LFTSGWRIHCSLVVELSFTAYGTTYMKVFTVPMLYRYTRWTYIHKCKAEQVHIRQVQIQSNSTKVPLLNTTIPDSCNIPDPLISQPHRLQTRASTDVTMQTWTERLSMTSSFNFHVKPFDRALGRCKSGLYHPAQPCCWNEDVLVESCCR